jgi:hypothetical protein
VLVPRLNRALAADQALDPRANIAIADVPAFLLRAREKEGAGFDVRLPIWWVPASHGAGRLGARLDDHREVADFRDALGWQRRALGAARVEIGLDSSRGGAAEQQ